MPKYILFVLALLPLGNLRAQYRQGQPVVEAEACLQPWIKALDYVARRAGGADLQQYRMVMANVALAEPVFTANGQFASRVISAPRDKGKPWVTVVPVCHEAKLPKAWVDFFTQKDFAASYQHEQDLLVLRGKSLRSPQLLAGLVLVHELRHKWQRGHEVTERYREVDAYEFEFAVLDRMKLRSYDAMIRDEVKRLRSEYLRLGGAKQNTTDPRLLQIFEVRRAGPDVLGGMSTEIFICANFKLLDGEFPNRMEAIQKKIQFLSQFGYK